MNALEAKLSELDGDLINKFIKTSREIESLLTKYDTNFPTYTDHSSAHTREVFELASQLLTGSEIDNLNADEIYVLSMASILHDIGMCIPEEKIKELSGSEGFLEYREAHAGQSVEEYIRDIHHELSSRFINDEWKLLNIPNERYAEAIGLVAKGHRKVDLANLEEYGTKYFVRSGRGFICLPYIASVLRLADELDITNVRTPALLHKYYLPNNEHSRKEWHKHIATTQVNFAEDYVSYQVKCSDHNMLAALETQFEKVQKTLHYCQKIVRTIGNTEDRRFSLNIMRVIPKYQYVDFDPKGIKFSFDVQNVTATFIGEDLYDDPLAALREAVQNSIDSCLYRKKLEGEMFLPSVSVVVEPNRLLVVDNGLGMDEFIIETFFGRLGSSFYEQSQVKSKFDAIGQFGVGVFSYFLISDFIEVATKTEHGPKLKFRINNDPKSYFHFYDKSDRIDQGTTLVLNLKASFVNEFKFGTIESYLRKYFRFIDCAIVLSGDNDKVEISSQPIEIDCEREIRSRIAIQHKDQFRDLEIVRVKIDNDQLVGECGLIVRKLDSDFSFAGALSLLDYELFDSRTRRSGFGEVSISQKGVFINNYSGDLLAGFVGNVNLIRKQRLNINRQEFSNPEKIVSILSDFEIKIIDLLFGRLSEIFKPKDLSSLTQEFLGTYLNYSQYDVSRELKDVLKNRLFVKVIDGGKTRFISLSTLVQDYKSFLLVGNFEKATAINNYFKRPVISCKVDKTNVHVFSSLKTVLRYALGYNPSIVKMSGLGYQKFDLEWEVEHFKAINELRRSTGRYIGPLEPSEDRCLMSSIWIGKKVKIGTDERFCFNSKHDFISTLLREKDGISMNNDVKRVCRSSMDIIEEFYSWTNWGNEKLDQTLSTLNRMMEPLKSTAFFYRFTKKDFK